MNKTDFQRDLLSAATKLISDTASKGRSDFPFDYVESSIDGLDLNLILDEHEGDGRNHTRITEFIVDHQSIGHIKTSGTYSSWDSSTWHEDETRVVHLRNTIVAAWVNVDGSEDAKHTFI